MKKYAFLFLLLPVMGLAQEITLDTTYLVNVNGVFLVAHDVKWDNGGRQFNIDPNPLGDSTKAAEFLWTNAINASQEVGGAAGMYLYSQPLLIKKLRDLNGLYQSLTGVTIFRPIADRIYPEHTGQARVLLTFVYRIDGVSQGDWELFQQSNKNVRLRNKATPTTFYAGEILSENTMRFQVNGSGDVYFYKAGRPTLNKEVWSSIDKKHKLILK